MKRAATMVNPDAVRNVVGIIGMCPNPNLLLRNTLMYAALLTIMRQVMTTKSVEYMPFTLSLVSFLNGICWTTYALIRFDIFITIPNGMGTLLGAAQLILYFCYYESTPKDAKSLELPVTAGDDKEGSTRAGL